VELKARLGLGQICADGAQAARRTPHQVPAQLRLRLHETHLQTSQTRTLVAGQQGRCPVATGA